MNDTDILKKFGAEPYIPGKKITVMLSIETLLVFDQIFSNKSKRENEKPIDVKQKEENI
jgi:hypothetical protein